MWSLIVAVENSWGIGKNGGMPWSFKEDFDWFKEHTTNVNVLFGRRTWRNLPQPAKERMWNKAHILCREQTKFTESDMVVCGGGKAYSWAFTHHIIQRLYITRICGTFECDSFFSKEYLHWYSLTSNHVSDCINRIDGQCYRLEFRTYDLRQSTN